MWPIVVACVSTLITNRLRVKMYSVLCVCVSVFNVWGTSRYGDVSHEAAMSHTFFSNSRQLGPAEDNCGWGDIVLDCLDLACLS
jgi:hypothetical protein